MSEINLTKENFEAEVLKSEKLVLVDFWATWCGPCKMLAPVLSEFAEENEEKVKVGKVNVDEQRELATKYQISSIPTLLLFKDGSVINNIVGFCSKTELEKLIDI
ncbi:MAG: thioredoxin [Clostridia bacterium]|nr:thioredoxin [Clostridia bacterium]